MILKFDFQRDEVSFFFLLSHPTALSCITRTRRTTTELFTVQQIIGCGDEAVLAAGTVDYIGFSYYMTNAVRADAAATNGEDLG